MENDFSLEDRQDFRINPHVWLRALLAIAGDREKKAKVIQKITQKTGVSPEQVEVIIATTIGILIKQTRSN
jgi:hypothetical protein